MFVWPNFKRWVVAPALGALDVQYPYWLKIVPGMRGFESQMIVTDFWETFAPWYIAIPFLLVCGFAVVYFLGSKGFCVYGCPYAGFFRPAARISLGSIRVTDACEHCGHCTAVCTSNVRVHEEVRDFGMVVDPACMKCMDCVSVCPNDALYFGLGKPPVLARPRDAGAARRRKRIRANAKRFDLTWPEEIACAAVFTGMFLAFRNMLELVPMLMAIGLAGIGTFAIWKLWSLVSRPNVRVQSIVLKHKGRVRRAGWAFAVGAVGMVGIVAWSGVVRYHLWRGDLAYNQMHTPASATLQPGYVPAGSEAETARAGIAMYDMARSIREGGIGWRRSPATLQRLAYLRLIAGDLPGARRDLESILRRGHPLDPLVLQLAQVMQRTGATRDQIMAMYQTALDRFPRLDRVRAQVAQWRLSTSGDAAGAMALWEEAIDSRPRDARLLMAAAGFAAGAGLGDESLRWVDRALSVGTGDAALRVRAARILAASGRNDRAAELAIEASAGAPKDPGVQFAAGMVLLQVGREQEGVALVDLAADLDADNAARLVDAAGVHARLGDREQMRRLVAAAVEHARTDPWTLLSLGRAIVQMGQGLGEPKIAESGLGLLQAAGEQRPESSLIMDTLVRASLSMGRADVALDALERADRAGSVGAGLARFASEAFGILGKPEQASRWNRRALDLERAGGGP